MAKKLEILVPQYKETDEVIKPLLDSIKMQRNINFDEIGVIIVNDGTDVRLSKELLKSYPFDIKYVLNEHLGVSGTRNKAFDTAKAKYVMWCDADDMFFSVNGIYLIFQEMKRDNGFKVLASAFMEEQYAPVVTRQEKAGKVETIPTGEYMFQYGVRGDFRKSQIVDSVFVHGKAFNRKFLLKNNIRWNQNLTIHEDSFFNILAQVVANGVRYIGQPFYLWCWRDDSVCRHDGEVYILKTYNNLIDSNTALIKELLDRGYNREAQRWCIKMVLDGYQTLNKKEWINQENQEYRKAVEDRYKQYWKEFKSLYNAEHITTEEKNLIYSGIKSRFMTEGVLDEQITLKDWIAKIEA